MTELIEGVYKGQIQGFPSSFLPPSSPADHTHIEPFSLSWDLNWWFILSKALTLFRDFLLPSHHHHLLVTIHTWAIQLSWDLNSWDRVSIYELFACWDINWSCQGLWHWSILISSWDIRGFALIRYPAHPPTSPSSYSLVTSPSLATLQQQWHPQCLKSSSLMMVLD